MASNLGPAAASMDTGDDGELLLTTEVKGFTMTGSNGVLTLELTAEAPPALAVETAATGADGIWLHGAAAEVGLAAAVMGCMAIGDSGALRDSARAVFCRPVAAGLVNNNDLGCFAKPVSVIWTSDVMQAVAGDGAEDAGAKFLAVI